MREQSSTNCLGVVVQWPVEIQPVGFPADTPRRASWLTYCFRGGRGEREKLSQGFSQVLKTLLFNINFRPRTMSCGPCTFSEERVFEMQETLHKFGAGEWDFLGTDASPFNNWVDVNLSFAVSIPSNVTAPSGPCQCPRASGSCSANCLGPLWYCWWAGGWNRGVSRWRGLGRIRSQELGKKEV